ncbi:MAG: hypothetical protein OES79_05130 [Planctomycetota bacterium]|nr:hypothetical protein [Planctomycetota bacterium]
MNRLVTDNAKERREPSRSVGPMRPGEQPQEGPRRFLTVGNKKNVPFSFLRAFKTPISSVNCFQFLERGIKMLRLKRLTEACLIALAGGRKLRCMAYAGLWLCFVIGLLLMSPFTAQADEFTFVWSDTIANTDNLPPGVDQFDAFTFSIIVDNGGSDTASEIWDAADFISIALDVDNGSYTGNSSAIDGGASGTFATDGMSNIISVPASWLSTTGSGTDNQTGKDFDWFINGANAFWVDSDPQPPFILNATMGSLNTETSSWTLSSETSGGGGGGGGATPEPSAFVLALLGLVGLTLGRRPRRRRG